MELSDMTKEKRNIAMELLGAARAMERRSHKVSVTS
jgi:hypothetical protein